MDYLATIFTSLLGCVFPRIVRVVQLESKLESLERETKTLNGVHEDVANKVEREEEQQMRCRRLKEVEGWLEGTRTLIEEASETAEQGRREVQSRCLWGRCPTKCVSSYKIAREVEKKLAEVKEAVEKARFETVTYELSYLLGEARPLEDTVGLDVIFQKAWTCINDENIGIVGLYGVGGVGKTTLLTKINNELIKDSSSPKLVIWVTVEKSATVKDVQEVIYNRLNLKDENWYRKTSDERCTLIYQFLSRKQFALLLDDLWERLDLSKVGIPLPGPGSGNKKMVKIAFTTRSEQVCREMEAKQTIQVTCLAPSEAKALFNAKVGEEALNSNPEIRQLAETMARYCGGLPIALITIGRAMSSKTELEAWRRAERFMRDSPSKITSMSFDVYPVLKLSYDSLSDERIKQCFLYCALFPEGYDIPKEDLVKCWIDEDFIHRYDDESEALDQGFDITESLMSACLLETSERENCVKMHDVIRDMALWIADQEGKKWNPSRVEELIRSIDAMRRMFDRFGHLRVLDLSNQMALSKLPAQISRLVCLRYLNLSGTRIAELPAEISKCARLQYLILSNTRITEFSVEIPKLAELRCLNVSGTRIAELPVEIGKLVKLNTLDVSRTEIAELPMEICMMASLQVLDVSGTRIRELPLEFEESDGVKHIKRVKCNELRKLLMYTYDLDT